MDDPLSHGSLEPDGLPYTAIPAMPATTQGLACDGFQLITDMVESRSDGSFRPGLNNSASFSITNYPGTQGKLVPRDAPTTLWKEEFNDLLGNRKRSHILVMTGPPALATFSASFLTRYPNAQHSIVLKAYAKEYMLYLQHNTDVYHILRASMTLQGPFVNADIQLFADHFSLGDMRDGKGLYDWATSFTPASSSEAPVLRHAANKKHRVFVCFSAFLSLGLKRSDLSVIS